MKKNFTVLRNRIDPMPLYNRSHGQNKPRDAGDIALTTHKKQVYLEKEVKAEDTLQSIALEFNVTVAELKRVNNIHKDNEIYARKFIKVPSNPLSLLLEKEYFSIEPQPSISQTPSEKHDIIVETVNNSNCIPLTENKRDGEQKETPESPLMIANEEEESVSLLSPVVEHKTNDVISCNGADWGISWHALLLVTLVLGVGGPVLYVFWFLWGRKEKDEGS